MCWFILFEKNWKYIKKKVWATVKLLKNIVVIFLVKLLPQTVQNLLFPAARTTSYTLQLIMWYLPPLHNFFPMQHFAGVCRWMEEPFDLTQAVFKTHARRTERTPRVMTSARLFITQTCQCCKDAYEKYQSINNVSVCVCAHY